MVFSTLSRIPLLGEVVRIFNTYAYRGDLRADQEFAGLKLWVTAFWVPVVLASVGAALCVPDLVNKQLPSAVALVYSVEARPGAIATGALPSLLGFGIGVYALIFGLHKGLLKQLQESYTARPGEKQKPGSALVVNAEMAVPLLVLAITILVGVMEQVAPKSDWVRALSWYTLWLSLIFTIELVTTLFALGENVVLKTLSDDQSTPPKQ